MESFGIPTTKYASKSLVSAENKQVTDGVKWTDVFWTMFHRGMDQLDQRQSQLQTQLKSQVQSIQSDEKKQVTIEQMTPLRIKNHLVAFGELMNCLSPCVIDWHKAVNQHPIDLTQSVWYYSISAHAYTKSKTWATANNIQPEAYAGYERFWKSSASFQQSYIELVRDFIMYVIRYHTRHKTYRLRRHIIQFCDGMGVWMKSDQDEQTWNVWWEKTKGEFPATHDRMGWIKWWSALTMPDLE